MPALWDAPLVCSTASWTGFPAPSLPFPSPRGTVFLFTVCKQLEAGASLGAETGTWIWVVGARPPLVGRRRASFDTCVLASSRGAVKESSSVFSRGRGPSGGYGM